MARLVTQEGLAYEQAKDSYRRATLLGAMLIGAGALFAFYGYRIRKSQHEYAVGLEHVKQLAGALLPAAQTLGVDATALRSWSAQQKSGQFSDVFRVGEQGKYKISVPLLVGILGAVILVYSLFRQERWAPPRNSFVIVETEEKKKPKKKPKKKGRKGKG